MYKKIALPLLCITLLFSCNKDKEILNSLNEYNLTMEQQGYRFGDKIKLPNNVTENAQVTISVGDRELKEFSISPENFSLGANAVTFNIKKEGGEILKQDALIYVYAKEKEKEVKFSLVKEYPHDAKAFVQGFEMHGDVIYESNGQNGESRVWKYQLGQTTPMKQTFMADEYFGEGLTLVGDMVYQLSWHHKKGFIYDKNNLNLLAEFLYPSEIGEGWGLCYDGKYLLMSDGSHQIYFIDPKDTLKVVKKISVAGYSSVYEKINELEYYNGYIYANLWQQPFVIKIDPNTGEVLEKLDLSIFVQKHTKNEDDVLNGITFKGGNMLVTGKYWDKIYELKL